MVKWVILEQVEDLVIEHSIEVLTRNFYAFGKISTLLEINELLYFFQGIYDTINGFVLSQVSHELLRLLNIASRILRYFNKEFVEMISAPLDAVLNLIRKVFEHVPRKGLFRRVL